MLPRIPEELARLDRALAGLEAAINDFGPTPSKSGFETGDDAANIEAPDVKDIARRVDRVIDRLETVLGE